MARTLRFKKKVDINKVTTKIVVLAITLWVAGLILHSVADAMKGTTPIFAKAYALLGFVLDSNNTITGQINPTGFMTIIGVVGVASIILEFVEFSL